MSSSFTFISTLTPLSPSLSTSEECAICTQSYAPSAFPHHAVITPCGHIFGHQCLVTWLADGEHNTCPMCRTELFHCKACMCGICWVERYHASILMWSFELSSDEQFELDSIEEEDEDDDDGVWYDEHGNLRSWDGRYIAHDRASSATSIEVIEGEEISAWSVARGHLPFLDAEDSAEAPRAASPPMNLEMSDAQIEEVIMHTFSSVRRVIVAWRGRDERDLPPPLSFVPLFVDQVPGLVDNLDLERANRLVEFLIDIMRVSKRGAFRNEEGVEPDRVLESWKQMVKAILGMEW